MPRIIFGLLTFVYAYLINGVAFAETITVVKDAPDELIMRIVTEYVMGDGDTIVNGRDIATQNAKKLAAEKAGSYIQMERIIVNDSIKRESINTLSTALMSVVIEDEDMTVTVDKRLRLEITVLANLDKKTLMGRLGVLKNDDQQQAKFNAMIDENGKLRKELETLNKRIESLNKEKVANKRVISEKRSDLYTRRNDVLTKIVVSEDNIRRIVMERDLTILAKQGSLKQEEAERDIDINVFKYIKDNIAVTIGEPGFIDNRNGTYDVEMSVSFRYDSEKIYLVLDKYLNIHSADAKNSVWSRVENDKLLYKNPEKIAYGNNIRNPLLRSEMDNTKNSITIHYDDNSGDRRKVSYSEKLFRYILNKSIALEIGNDSMWHTVTIAGKLDTRTFEEKIFKENNNYGLEPSLREVYSFKYSIVPGESGVHLEGATFTLRNVPLKDLKNIQTRVVIK
jgi:hypothetical protein